MKEEQNKEYEIIVNGRVKVVVVHKLTYLEVIKLAFGEIDNNPNAVYTVTYSKGKKDDKGTLVEGEEVTLKKEMVFNVTRTDKS